MKNKESKHFEGVVQHYTANKHNDIDGLVITTDKGRMDLKFPPYTAEYIMAKIKEGAFINVAVNEGNNHKHGKPNPPKQQLDVISDQSTGDKVTIADYPAPKPAEGDEWFDFVIEQPHLLRGSKDEITAIQFDGKLFHLKPHLAEALAAEPSRAVNIKAKKRPEGAGFVNINSLTVYHVIELTAANEPAIV